MNPAAFASLPASACTLGTQGTGQRFRPGPDHPQRLRRGQPAPAGAARAVGTGGVEQAEVDLHLQRQTASGVRRSTPTATGPSSSMTATTG